MIALQFAITCLPGGGSGTTTSITTHFSINDAGNASYMANDIFKAYDPGAGSACTANITFTRKNTGTLATYFRSGSIIAMRTAEINIQTEGAMPSTTPTP